MKKKISIILAFAILSSLAAAQGPSTELELEVMQAEPNPLQSGEYADVWIRAENVGDTAATDPTFRLVEQFPFEPTRTEEWTPSGELDPRETYQFRAQVRVSENAVFGENELRIDASGGGEHFVQHQLPLEVRTSDRSLVVEELEMPERMGPGTTHEMSLTLENQENQRFRNIDVTLETEETPVATRETSRKRIGSVGSGESATAEFNLDVDPEADRELYKLPINIQYENQAGDEFELTETTGVNIGGYPDIEVGLEERDLYTPGAGSVTLRIVNRGEGQARFSQLEIEETESLEVISESSEYIGTMFSDGYQTERFEVYTDNDEKLEIPVTLEYRDGQGEQVEEFTIERDMYSSAQLQRYGMEGSGAGWILGIIALIGAVVGVLIWKRRKDEE